jgi:hypothetical protein
MLIGLDYRNKYIYGESEWLALALRNASFLVGPNMAFESKNT